MRFKERNNLANRCKEWMKEQIENNITTPLDTVHMVLAYLDVNGYLNGVVRCKECKYVSTDATCCHVCCRDGMGLKPYHVYHDDYCSYGKRREDAEAVNTKN